MALELQNLSLNTCTLHSIITGWGKLGGRSGVPNNLQEANVDVYTRGQCASRHGNAISNYHICVGKTGRSGGCQGDSKAQTILISYEMKMYDLEI